MQIKTTMRYHFTPVRMAIIKKSTNNKCWRGCGENRMFLHCWWKTVYSLKKLGIKPAYDLAIPLLGISPKETKIEKDMCIPLFIAALFTIARTRKQLRCPSTDEWIKNLWYTSGIFVVHNGIFLSHKKEHIWVSSEEVDEPRTYYANWNKSEKDKYSILMHIYGI